MNENRIIHVEAQEVIKLQGQIERLTLILENHVTHTEERISAQRKTLDRHSVELYGGEGGSPGMKIQLDRITQTEISRLESDRNLKNIVGGILVGVALLIAQALWSAYKIVTMMGK